MVSRISVAWRLESFAVIGLTRIYCNQSDEFCLVDVFSQDAPRAVENLREQGWEIEAEIPVWDRSLKRSNDFCVAGGNLYASFMGIHAADHPIVEHQDEDCFDAWLRRKQKEKDEPWAFSSEVDGSSLRDYLSVNNDEWVNVWAWVAHLCLLVIVFNSILCSSDILRLLDNTKGI